MRKHFVISVGCEYGCYGAEIGKMIAKDFGIAYYDRKLVDDIMEEAGFSKDLAEKAEAGVDIRGKATKSAAKSTESTSTATTLFKGCMTITVIGCTFICIT